MYYQYYSMLLVYIIIRAPKVASLIFDVGNQKFDTNEPLTTANAVACRLGLECVLGLGLGLG
jgi:hypothetical protein